MKNNPYVGPRPYERQDRHNFFGRNREARELRSLILSEREMLFYAQSGAGKTSLLNARIIPMLEEEGFRVLPVARVGSELPPGIDAGAVDNVFIFSALLTLAGEDADPHVLLSHTLCSFLEERFAEGTSALSRVPGSGPDHPDRADLEAQEFPGDDEPHPWVLILDQFEEVFTTHRDRWQEAAGFFLQVREALDALPDLGVVFAMREDHVAAIDPYTPIFPRRLRARFRMERLGPKGALAAVQRPAENAGCRYDPGVAERLVDNLRQTKVRRHTGEETILGPYVEPVQLQVVCSRLWENLPEQEDNAARRRAIQWEDVEQYGNIDRALTDFYESALATTIEKTSVSERRLRQWFDEHLITPMGTRGLVLRGQEETEEISNVAVDVLEKLHLIRAEVHAGACWYELTHDRLIEPVQTNNAIWREAHLSTLQQQAVLWENQGQPNSLLLRDQSLMEADAWAVAHEAELNEIERNFLEDSREAQVIAEQERRQNRLIRWLAIAAMIFSVIAIVLVIVAWGQFQVAEWESRVAQSRALAAQSESVVDQELAVLLGLEAVYQTRQDTSDTATAEAIKALHRAIAYSRWHTTFRGHRDKVWWAAWSSNDARIVTASDDGSARIWDAHTGEELFTLSGHTGPVLHAAWSSNDARIVTASDDGSARIWDAHTGEEIFTLSNHTASVNFVAWNSNGTCILTISDDKTAKLWNASTGEELVTFTGHGDKIQHAAWSWDNTRIATGSYDASVIVWDAYTGEELFRLKGHYGGINYLAWSSDDTRIVTASFDGSAIVWDVDSGTKILTFTGHTNWLWYAEWDSNDTHILTTSSDGRVKVWDARSGTEVFTLSGHTDGVRRATWSSDDARIVTASEDGTAKVWDARIDTDSFTFKGHTGAILYAAWNQDDTRIATASYDGTARVWDVRTGTQLSILSGHTSWVLYAAWSSDETRIATASQDGSARVWDARTGEQLLWLKGHHDLVWHATWSSDDTRLLTASADGTAKVWDASTGENLLTLIGHVDWVNYAAWSSDDAYIVTASRDGTAKVWDAHTGAVLLTLSGHAGWVQHAAWNSDDTRIVTAGWDGMVRVWDARTGEELFALSGPGGSFYYVAWNSTDTRIVATGTDGSVVVWDAHTGKESLTISAHTDWVWYAAWSSDDTRILTASADGSVKVWDADTGKELFTLSGHTDRVYRAAWNSDDTRILTVGQDGIARIYFARIDDLTTFACTRTDRNLTQAEWERYLPGEPYRQTCPDLPIHLSISESESTQ